MHFCHEFCTKCGGGSDFTNCFDCVDGTYFDYVIFGCLLCDATCATCDKIKTNCSSCRSGYFLDSNKCVSNCTLSGTYGDEKEKKCMSCNPVCRNCMGPSVSDCKDCNPGYYFLETIKNRTCLKQCPEGYFTIAIDNTCTPCFGNCIKCLGPENQHCVSCQDETNCLRCLGNDTRICLECNRTSSWLLEGSFACSEGESCPPFHYNITSNKTCHRCFGDCSKCLSGERDQCISCVSGCHRCNVSSEVGEAKTCIEWDKECVVREGECLMSCPSGEFKYLSENSPWSVCSPCNSSCASCFGNENNCTECFYERSSRIKNTCINHCPPEAPLMFENYTCVEKCPLDHYLSPLEVDNGRSPERCLSCHFQCATCEKDNDIESCTSCKNETGFRIVPGKNKSKCQKFCMKSCPVTTYFYEFEPDSWDGCDCFACHKSCYACNNNYLNCTSVEGVSDLCVLPFRNVNNHCERPQEGNSKKI